MTLRFKQGDHRACVLGYEVQRALTTGMPMVAIHVRVTHERAPDNQLVACQPAERVILHALGTEQAILHLQSDFSAMGLPFTDLTQLHPNSPNAINLVGKGLDLTCRHEAVDGVVRERWAIRRRETLPLGDLQALQAQLGHCLKKEVIAS